MPVSDDDVHNAPFTNGAAQPGKLATRLWLTTPAGLEDLAARECAECSGWSVERTERGVVEVTVAMDCPQDIVQAARKLRLAQRVLAFVLRETLPAELDRDQALAWMQERACRDGGPALLRLAPLWRAFVPSQGVTDAELAFHVRAQRGGSHSFSSDDAKRCVALGLTAGSGLRGACRLEFQLNIDVRVHHESVWAGLCLLNTRQEAALAASSPESAAPPRELSVTTLNSTIAHAMLRALRPRAGSLVVDPMAGCGTLPELGCAAQRECGAPCFFLAGDVSAVAVAKARANICAARAAAGGRGGGGGFVDVVLWDATRLPLRAGCVDHFVSDLPFGKRLGSRADNRKLYPQAIEQMRRALRPTTVPASAAQQQQTRRAPADNAAAASTDDGDGSAQGFAGPIDAPLELVLLSADRHGLTTAVRGAHGRPWRVELQRRVNVGGLDGLLLGARLAKAPAAPGSDENGPGSAKHVLAASSHPDMTSELGSVERAACHPVRP